jgi:Ca2+:H+ antiporter
MNTIRNIRLSEVFSKELQFWAGALTVAAITFFCASWLDDLANPVWYAFLMVWLFSVMLWLSFGVVRHAECLAVILGEPYGTLILTLSVITIEVVMISAIMLSGENNPTLARDTMFSVLMIVLNGMVGLSLLMGGLRHHEQDYNLQGANSYLAVAIPLAVLGLVLPRFTEYPADASPSLLLACFLIIESTVLYGIFLWLQTMQYRHFFVHPETGDSSAEEDARDDDHHDLDVRSTPYHTVFLICMLLVVILLSKKMAMLVDHGIGVLGAPQALGGFLVAALVLSPEALAAIGATLTNRLQRSVNICLGSALATIGMTIPAALAIGLVTGRTVELGLGNVDLILLAMTFMVSILTFGSGRTNVLLGAVHLTLFFSYVILIFDQGPL